jgi:hypothetical protein
MEIGVRFFRRVNVSPLIYKKSRKTNGAKYIEWLKRSGVAVDIPTKKACTMASLWVFQGIKIS